MKKAIDWFSHNHVAANSLMLFVLVMGIKTWFELRKEIFPETSVDAILIAVPYPDAAPEEVEKGIVIPIEEEIQDLGGIDKITSSASEDAGTVLVQVKSGSDVRDLLSDIKTRIDAIDNFPEEAEEPRLEEILIKNQTLNIAVSADTDEATLRKLADSVRDDLLLIDGITQVQVAGVRPYEISIEISEEVLQSYGLTFDEVVAAVRKSSIDLPSGSVKTDGGEVLIRTSAKRYTSEEFSAVTLVTRDDGSRVTLGKVASVIDAFEDVDLATRFDGKSAVLVKVFRTGDEDTLDVAHAAKKYVKDAKKRMPEGVELEIWNDESLFLEGRLDLLFRNGIAGLVLVFIVLALFLRPSLAALVALGIPVAFAGAIWLMPTFDISVNMISLFAFILVLGIVVDDAIVVGENVFRRMRTGEDPKTAAPLGTHEVGVVVIFGIITTMIAFTPMLGVSGVSGKIWRNIPWVVIPTLTFSLLQSKLVLPAHLALLPKLDPGRPAGRFTRVRRMFSDGLEHFVERRYRPFLNVCLRYRYVVLTSFLAVLVTVVAAVKTGWVKFQFFPEVEAEIISAKLKLPNGVPFSETQKAIRKIADAGRELGGLYTDAEGRSVVRHILASSGAIAFSPDPFAKDAGATSVNVGDVTIELSPASARSVRSIELASKWRELTGVIPGAVELSFQSIAAGGGNAIDLQVSGDNLGQLEQAVEQIEEAMGGYTGVIDIADNNLAGKRELKLGIRESAEALGLRLEDMARQVRQGFFGEEVQRLQRGRDEVKVMVRYTRDERRQLASIEQMKIRLPGGGEVPFSEVGIVSFGRGYSSIERADRRRAITITADIDKSVPGANANEVVAGLEAGVLREILVKFPGVTYSFEGEQKDQRDSLREIGIGFFIALLGMYVLMGIPLRSYIQPVIIMSVIPFGFVGAVLGHVVMFTELSIMSMCGIVALAGVVVNDSLVLVDYVNRERAMGCGVVQAAWEAGAKRFRPILLTSLTTFAGLLPMLLETDLQAKFLIPMAISLAFGILFATGITLILVPSLYLVLDDVKRLFLREVEVAGPDPSPPVSETAGK